MANVSREHTHALSVAKTDTGNWFLSSFEFEAWVRDPPSLLWLYGIRRSNSRSSLSIGLECIADYKLAGSGKTVLW